MQMITGSSFTCNVDVLHDVQDIVVIDLSSPLRVQDVIDGALELHRRSQFVHLLPAPRFTQISNRNTSG